MLAVGCWLLAVAVAVAVAVAGALVVGFIGFGATIRSH